MNAHGPSSSPGNQNERRDGGAQAASDGKFSLFLGGPFIRVRPASRLPRTRLIPTLPYSTGLMDPSPTLSEPEQHDHAKTGEWAPPAPAFEELPPSGLPHLPAATSAEPRKYPSRLHGRGGKAAAGGGAQQPLLTSSPFTVALSPAQASLSYSLSRLLSLPRFAAFLHTPLGYAQFAAYLAGTDPQNQSLQELELWKDTYVLSQLANQTESGARGISNVYLARGEDGNSSYGPELPDHVRRTLFEALSTKWSGLPKLEAVSKHLLESLYRREFEGFIKTRLVRHTQAQLAKYNLKPEERGGIGSSFILTNPRLRDDPIVLVSPGFCELTVRSHIVFLWVYGN